ncbi:adipocyte plasma membrane-associated protein-like [Anneissia japonica]|uniref:adipocyte plasma membrane-associated protein-like n=1 Tax=Anneissia japonica TaxID=1529436 RepID=UPI0014256D74|nr:adipocyte plasma membrane-associated protein-like [Anneissia japonica]XP_033096636.1 adipocyte plasma membrane-associated protein-like [Anneissia japonica]
MNVTLIGTYENENLCGRPLGLRFDKAGFLYVVEAYSGLYKLNVSSGEMVQLVNSDDKSVGQPMKFVNDLDVTSDGAVYFSDTSANFERRDFAHLSINADKSGRIFKFDPNTNKTVVVQKDLGWVNGVQVSPDEDYLLYSEGQFSRIMKLHLEGPQKGKVEVFSDNLPGFPDNIRLSRKNSYWVAINALRKQLSLYDFLTDKPRLRTLLLKVVDPNFFLKSLTKYGLIIELDIHGNIIRSLHDEDGGVLHSCSEVFDTGNTLFIGSFKANFIGKLEL